MERERDGLAAAGGAIAALALALLLSTVRDRIGLANVALLLTLVVVLAAMVGGRIAGVTTAVVAALGFNALHARPYGTLRIDRPEDVLTCVLMVVVGVAVGELAHWAGRRTRRGDHGAEGVHRLAELSDLVAARASAEVVLDRADRALVEQLRLASCRFVAGSDSLTNDSLTNDSLTGDGPNDEGLPPDLARRGSIDGPLRHHPDGFELPSVGVSIPVRGAAGSVVGRFVLVPTPGTGVSLADREVALLVADLVAPVLQGSRST